MNLSHKRRLAGGFLRKAAAALLCLLLVTLLNFFLPRMMPGDPVLMLTGMDEDAVSAEQYSLYRQELGLDKPMGQQLADYFSALFAGDLGYSHHYREPVSALLLRRIPNTLLLAVPALVLSTLLAVVLGCTLGTRAGGLAERTTTAMMIFLDATPAFLLSMAAVWVFGYLLRWLPLGGLGSVTPPLGAAALLWDRLRHLVLPVSVLTLGSLPAKYLLIRGSVIAQRDSPCLLYARARGLSPWRVRFVHLFRTICPPFVALLGVNVGFLLTGSALCEAIFSIKGMGELFYDAVAARDFPTLQGCLLVTAAVMVAASAAADLTLLLLDPQRRYQHGQ